MKKVIRIEFEIENSNIEHMGMSGQVNVYEILFTEYDNVASVSMMLERVKKAIKLLKGYTMITANVTIKDSNDYTFYTNNDIVYSKRIVRSYGDSKVMDYNKSANRYHDSPDKFTKRTIEAMVSDAVDSGNRTLMKAVHEMSEAKVN